MKTLPTPHPTRGFMVMPDPARVAGFQERHNDYLANRYPVQSPTPADKPDLLFFFCPCCGFGFWETWELSHHAPRQKGKRTIWEMWEPLCPACPAHPNGPPRMKNL